MMKTWQPDWLKLHPNYSDLNTHRTIIYLFGSFRCFLSEARPLRWWWWSAFLPPAPLFSPLLLFLFSPLPPRHSRSVTDSFGPRRLRALTRLLCSAAARCSRRESFCAVTDWLPLPPPPSPPPVLWLDLDRWWSSRFLWPPAPPPLAPPLPPLEPLRSADEAAAEGRWWGGGPGDGRLRLSSSGWRGYILVRGLGYLLVRGLLLLTAGAWLVAPPRAKGLLLLLFLFL